MIWHILLVIASQFGFIFFRTLNVKYVADNGVAGAMLTGLMVNILWITTTGYGLTALYEQDWVLGIAYLVGGQIGVYYGMRKDRITAYIQNQWLNLRVVCVTLRIKWFADVIEGYDYTKIYWKDGYGEVYLESQWINGLPSNKALLQIFADKVTTEMIDKFYKNNLVHKTSNAREY